MTTLTEDPYNLVNGLFMGESRGIDLDFGSCLIDRETGFKESIESATGVLHFKQGSLSAAGGPLEKGFGIRVEPNHPAYVA